MIFMSRKLNLNIFFYIHLKVSQACANFAWFRLENAWQSAVLDVTRFVERPSPILSRGYAVRVFEV